jgi:hypothetical protein
MKGERDMPMLRLIPADEPPADEPLRFPTEAVRVINAARAASANASQRSSSSPPASPPQRDLSRDVSSALDDVTRCAENLSRELDVLGRLGCDDDGDDDRPRAA